MTSPRTSARTRSPARLGRLPAAVGRVFAGFVGLLLVLALGSRVAGAETRGQYLVIVDDSKSMDQSDPDRLVMLASLALAAALGEGDEVRVVGLNELAKGKVSDRFESPLELLPDRDGSEGQRPLAGSRYATMAQHEGATPCRDALERAAALLEANAAAGRPQTLLLLTDGDCSDGLEPAERWLGRLTSHAEGRFRFALLRKRGAGRADPELLAYARATGWTLNPDVSFDGRSLLRAFADVLSFAEGLNFDDGGRVGKERTFAGAREVRVLAVATVGGEAIPVVALAAGSREALATGPTFAHPDYAWRLRVAKAGPRPQPFAFDSPDASAEVLAIPRYGLLRVEAVIGSCAEDQRPPLPWTREPAVRSGQPACAYARLVGDPGETIDPTGSFPFAIELCEDEACTTATAMQPDADGTFNAQLGVLAEGRHERWFRADGKALAVPVIARRGVQAMAFGISGVTRADAPDKPIDRLALGELPRAHDERLTLQVSGSFPAGSEAELRCRVRGDAGSLDPLAGQQPCLRCRPLPATVALQDPFSFQVEISATALCPLVSGDGVNPGPGELPVSLELAIAGRGSAEAIGERTIPVTASLRHAVVEAQTLELTAGTTSRATIRVPAAVNAELTFALEAFEEGADGNTGDELPEDLSVTIVRSSQRSVTVGPGETTTVELELEAADCCRAGDYALALRVSAASGGPSLRVPLRIAVAKPSFWVCPGRQIAKWAGAALAVLSVLWLIRGFTSPAKFANTAVLARAESHEVLAKLGEGDEDWRLVASLDATRRGFYRPATVHLGGARAALPSLRELGDDARIEARSHGNATLIVDAEGVEQFRESTGWAPVPVGEHPVGSSVVLRRDDTYLMFRR